MPPSVQNACARRPAADGPRRDDKNRMRQLSASAGLHPINFVSPFIRFALIVLFSAVPIAQAQGLPFINAGPDSGFAQLDFAEIYLDGQNKQAKRLEEERLKNNKLIDAGVISALDLDAPNSAVEQFNHATSLLKEQNSKEAAKCLEKAIHIYPKFVSAHNALGLAYQDQSNPRAKSEFEVAAQLDPKFPGSFLNLGLLALTRQDFTAAAIQLSKAASLNPRNSRILAALAFAQNGDHEYEQTLKTAQQVHALEHRGMANVHYIAAAAAMALRDLDTIQRELTLFLNEDPTNPLAPTAKHNLEILEQRKTGMGASAGGVTEGGRASDARSLPAAGNDEQLKAQLDAADDKSAANCESCKPPAEENLTATDGNRAPVPSPEVSPRSSSAWFIRKTVDETAIFFAVSNHGHMVNDLELPNIQVRDDDKAPEKILQFVPQSKLPLRLGLVIDTSGSVKDRFSFEKRAAGKFLQKVLNGSSDLGFVAGFDTETKVTQDFTSETKELDRGIEQLTNGGGTALFDAVALACWKLADYPEHERVAKVLVVLSDGEDNSSHRSLKQVIADAETSGVTIYTVSTKEDTGAKSNADKILDALAERSGGESMFPGDMFALDKSLDKLRELIRSRYLIVYKPAVLEPNGKYRTIRITAERNGTHLQVHARKGYYSRNETTH
jgi:Ca-activated chloride channel homolog